MNKIRLGDVTSKIGSGATPRGGKEAYEGGRYSLIRSMNIHDNYFDRNNLAKINDEQATKLNNVSVKEGDVLINITGASVARVNIAPKDILPARVNQHVSIIRPDRTKLNPFYLHYYLIQPAVKKKLLSISIGSSREAITKGYLSDFIVTAPHISEQENISKILRLFDEKITLNDKLDTEIEGIARLIYNQWFVQFDFPDANNRPYKTTGGAMIYSKELKREIPAGWQVETLYKNTLTEIIKPKIDIFSGHKIYLDTSTVNDLAIGIGEQIMYSNRASRANMQPVANSVWFAKMQSSVKHVIVGKWGKDLIDNSILSTGFMGLTVKEHALAYIAGYIRNPYFEVIKDSNSHGATMSGIGNDDMKNIKLIVPPENVLREFSKSTSALWQQIDKNRRENKRLVELRDWLLPMLMNGQIKVGD